MKSNVSLINFQNHINRKNDRFALTLVDLLYVSNFKGGNSTINEDENLLSVKLNKYSARLRHIDLLFSNKILAELSAKEYVSLCQEIQHLLELCNNEECAIDGFKASYLSGLLHAYFPQLIPILDRRLLINLGIVSAHDLLDNGQVRSIEHFYPALLDKLRHLSRLEGKTLREIDQEYFGIELKV